MVTGVATIAAARSPCPRPPLASASPTPGNDRRWRGGPPSPLPPPVPVLTQVVITRSLTTGGGQSDSGVVVGLMRVWLGFSCPEHGLSQYWHVATRGLAVAAPGGVTTS